MDEKDVAQTLYSFFSRFGLTAYEENSVPSNAEFPYLTYQVAIGEFNENTALSCSIWYKSETLKDICQKEDEIRKKFGRGGEILETKNGYIWMKRGTPFSQILATETNDKIKRIYFNLLAEYVLTD